MTTATYDPAPGSTATIADFGDVLVQIFGGQLGAHDSDSFVLTGDLVGGGTASATFTGTGFSYFSFPGFPTVPTGGTIESIGVDFGGAHQGDLTVELPVSEVIGVASSGDEKAIAEYFQSFDYTINCTDANDIALFGSNIIGNVPFNLTGNDTIHLAGGNDNFYAGDGNDHMFGDAGFDTLVGGNGNDDLDGGANPEGPSGQGDIMLGGDGDDTYHVDSGLDLVDEDFVFPGYGHGGTDTIISTADFYWDTQSVGEFLQVSEDVVDAGGDGVTIVGGVFNNTLIGHSGTDVMFGRGGSDTYRAGDGVDFISLSTLGVPDAANYTADGNNTVIVDPRTTGAFSYDIVFEFDAAKDKADVSAYHYASADEVLAHTVDDGAGNCYTILGDGLDYLYFVGLEKADLNTGDFIV